MTSVALCTYNGEKYIEEQISSILNQSVPVDEIVVCDDGSTDNTLALIEKFHPHTKMNIRIYRNEHQLGVCANFQKAIDLCEGDIIFLSDQDDVWHQNKVEVVCKWFDENPTKEVVFSDGRLIDEEGKLINNNSLWKCFGLTNFNLQLIDHGSGIELFAYGNRVTGATMAIRSEFEYTHCFINYCKNGILHDGALTMLSLYNNQLGYVDTSLIDYRIHRHQKNGVGEYLTLPMNSDQREICYTASVWNSLTLPSALQQRISFLLYRERWHH